MRKYAGRFSAAGNWTYPLFLLLGSCGLSAQTSQPTGYVDVATPLAVLQDARIAEASGIVASRRQADCFYVHNDSGNRPRVFLIDRAGRTRAEIRLRGAQAIDYEDIAIAPGDAPGTFDVCVADIGDNLVQRPNVTIYRFAEPDLPATEGGVVEVEPIAYAARYADGPVNAEAFLVDPRTGEGLVFTKHLEGRCDVYKLAAPWDSHTQAVLTKVLALELPSGFPPARVVTAADVDRDGRRVAVRCMVGGWEWRATTTTAPVSIVELLRTTPADLPLPPERQGEALCYAADGGALLTVSEGASPTLFELRAVAPTTSQASGN